MSFVTINPELVTQLDASTDSITLCTPEGVPLGAFVPFKAMRGPQIDETEMKRRIADTTSKRFTASELLARLEKR